VPELTGASSSLLLRPGGGRPRRARQRYLPFPAACLVNGEVLPFNLYRGTEHAPLQVFLGAGEPLRQDVISSIRQDASRTRLYVREEEREPALVFQERVLRQALADEEVRVDEKCQLLRGLLGSLSREVFENARQLTVYRQREIASGMVDFVLREPSSLRALLSPPHREYDPCSHSVNVAIYTLAIALQVLGSQGRGNLREIVAATALHDIGKSLVRQEILEKPEALDEAEWREMKRHSGYGYNLLRRENTLTEETSIILLQHHERPDGGGYPLGLAGDQIHPYARICAVADAYDALTTDRSFQPAHTPFDALRVMRRNTCAQFDPDVYRAFVLLMKRRE